MFIYVYILYSQYSNLVFNYIFINILVNLKYIDKYIINLLLLLSKIDIFYYIQTNLTLIQVEAIK